MDTERALLDDAFQQLQTAAAQVSEAGEAREIQVDAILSAAAAIADRLAASRVSHADILLLSPLHDAMGVALAGTRGVEIDISRSHAIIRRISGLVSGNEAAEYFSLKEQPAPTGCSVSRRAVYGLTYAVGRAFDHYMEYDLARWPVDASDLRRVLLQGELQGRTLAGPPVTTPVGTPPALRPTNTSNPSPSN